MTQNLLVGKGKNELTILPKMANRHGLIAGGLSGSPLSKLCRI